MRKGDKYIVNDQKCFITNGSVADFFVLYAYMDASKRVRGISAFVVEKSFPGLVYGKNENKMGMRGSVNSELYLEDMEVPAENLIGLEGKGFANLMNTLAMSRLFCASQAVGIAQGALPLRGQMTATKTFWLTGGIREGTLRNTTKEAFSLT